MTIDPRALLVRCLDLLLAALLLIPLLAICIPLAVLKLLLDGRPLFYNSTRIGRRGKPFTVFKFRTMVCDRDFVTTHIDGLKRNGFEAIPLSSPVYTPMGRFFERFQIVEFPQIVNVLLGSMSLVGYRPLPGRNCEDLAAELGPELVARRHASKPGVTGITQLIGKAILSNRDRLMHEINLGKFIYSDGPALQALAVYCLLLLETVLTVFLRRHLLIRHLQRWITPSRPAPVRNFAHLPPQGESQE